MLTRTLVIGAAATLGVAVWACPTQARAQFQAPPNALTLEDSGTLEGIQGNVLKFRDSKNEAWLLEIAQQTSLTISGEAGADYLRPGLTLELTGDIDKQGALAEPIAEVDVLSSKGRPTMGLFATGEGEDDTRPVRTPKAGSYRIRGKLASVKDGEVLIIAGRSKITGTVAEDLKVKLNLDDASAAQFGDTVKVKAWYYDRGRPLLNRPGNALAEDIKITLLKPPVTGKRFRATKGTAKTNDDPKAVKDK